MVQIWGDCVLPDLTERNGTLSEEEIEGVTCLSDAFCQDRDINALCFQVNEGEEEGVCKCRQEMMWNSAALECQVESVTSSSIQVFFLTSFFLYWQVYIDQDCSAIKYSHSASPIFQNILKAEDDYRRGYKDQREKLELLQNLTDIDSGTLSLLDMVPGHLCQFYGKAKRSLRNACRVNPTNPAGYLLGKSLPNKYTLPIPNNGTQNPEEALQGSLLLFFTMNKTDFHPITPPDIIPSMKQDRWKMYLTEAFCRSMEAFSEVFDTKPKRRVETDQGETWVQPEKVDFDDPIHRPATCFK